MRWLALILFCLPGIVSAEYLVAERTLRAGTIIEEGDVSLVEGSYSGGISSPEEAIGMEMRRAVYAGRAIRAQDIGPPALVERNQIVTLIYQSDTLSIQTEGRAMDRGGAGDFIRVMNLTSRTTVTGRVGEEGAVYVSQ